MEGYSQMRLVKFILGGEQGHWHMPHMPWHICGGQNWWVGPVLLRCGFPGSNWGPQSWQQAPLMSEPSLWPRLKFLLVKKGTSRCLKNVRQLQYELSVGFCYILTFSYIIYNANVFTLPIKAVIQMKVGKRTGTTEELSALSHSPSMLPGRAGSGLRASTVCLYCLSVSTRRASSSLIFFFLVGSFPVCAPTFLSPSFCSLCRWNLYSAFSLSQDCISGLCLPWGWARLVLGVVRHPMVSWLYDYERLLDTSQHGFNWAIWSLGLRTVAWAS